MTAADVRPERGEIIREPIALDALEVAEQPLSVWERVWNSGLVRKSCSC